MNIHGIIDINWTYPRPMIAFIKSQNKKNLIGCEIGLDHGLHMKSILKNLDMKRIYLIDPYLGYIDYLNSEDPHYIDYLKKGMDSAMKLIDGYKGKCDIRFYKMMTEDVTKDKIKDKLDFVYIDGNHAFDYVIKDIRFSMLHVKDGGVIGGHNTDRDSVIRAIVKAFPNKKIHLKGNDWWVIK